MRPIKFIGIYSRPGDNRTYSFSLFECPRCKSKTEKRTKRGMKAQFCSRKCYSTKRNLRGAYKESVLISGYRYILRTDHPCRDLRGYVSEHRLVAENKIGRYLYKNEHVHHINHDKLDNRPENLMVMTKSEHMRLHMIERNKRKHETPELLESK